MQMDRRPSIFNFVLASGLIAVLGGGERAAAQCPEAVSSASGCGALTGGTADEGAMTVDQLAAIVGPDAILADLNSDGMVDLDDVGLWAAGRERRGQE
ncbi:MAG: hypothetical protein FJ167_07285 [Gammaproteobacteria bacterium]|nr:hypothetical protein [Gammaproteobacteria bacterium]